MSIQFYPRTSARTKQPVNSLVLCAGLCQQLFLWRYLALFRAFEQHEKAKQADKPCA